MQWPIKFRAWNEYVKTMFEVDVLHIRNRTWEMPKFNQGDAQYMSLIYQPKTVLMQYTGLKDKNGVEIYEGDILGTTIRGEPKVLPGAVEQHENGAWLCGEGGEVWSLRPRIEVIGNIYENPELLK